MLPLLIVSDAVSGPTGLGRIAREIAVRADAGLRDICRIATLGGGPGSRRFPFQQYFIEGMDDFVLPTLPEVWDDWAGGEPGVILFIWDASRLGWFSRPEILCENPVLKSFLTAARFKRWIYAPLDAEGPNGKLTYPLTQVLAGFDRVLAYGAWGEEILRRALGPEISTEVDLTSIPHGIDSSVFYPRDRVPCRANFFKITQAKALRVHPPALGGNEPLIGTVATNQARKDWGLWAASCALFLHAHPQARFWVHTDGLERHWSIPALLADFGLMDRTVISLGCLEDDHMAEAYSACDLTLGIGLGEGFGYPLAESLACGTPVIHVNYAGGAEVIGIKEMLVDPVAYRYEGVYCCKRPVLDAKEVASKMECWLGRRGSLDSRFYWENLWPRWEAWLRRGLKT